MTECSSKSGETKSSCARIFGIFNSLSAVSIPIFAFSMSVLKAKIDKSIAPGFSEFMRAHIAFPSVQLSRKLEILKEGIFVFTHFLSSFFVDKSVLLQSDIVKLSST
eukprot:TRINITY_DN8236_c0_g1_i1.p1 TRINITY_DN8236_c0_g1~~TRINITY_DN8236_c0_g1_i1.p1  ORF type:complete len:107 (-),score=11.69 TRINITY_DN8236_c0_g1_i1:36-356(-)